MAGFNLRKLSELDLWKQYRIKISNMVSALENLNVSEDINRAWEKVKENSETSAEESLGLYELKKLKPWFDEERLRFSDQRKQAKMQWLLDPNHSNVDTVNNVRCKASRYFKNKRRNI